MKLLNLIQGTPEWHQHRATHFNASDAPAMLGVSPYKPRAELLRELATGIVPEVDSATQRRFDAGHRAEAFARPLAEQIIGEELFPCVGTLPGTKFSASFDGLTMLGDVAFEHKLLASRLRDAMPEGCTGADLPEDYRVQMEQQCMVSGAERVLFMASEWDSDHHLVEERHCWYTTDSALRARIVAGWDQFESDLAGFVPPTPPTPAVIGKSPESLPALRVEATGKVLASNLDDFRAHAMAVLGHINRDLKTDDDFADAESTVKWCKTVEDRLSATKDNVLAQMQSVDAVCRTIDEISDETRRIRLELDKLVKAEKEARKSEIVQHYVDQVRKHYTAINASMGAHAIAVPPALQSIIGAAIKGRKTLGGITDAADEATAGLKIAASQQADRVRACVAVLGEFPDYAHLFADRVTLCASKTPDDLRNLVKARIAEHQQREAERLERERERIRAEEAAKAQAEAARQATAPVTHESEPAPVPPPAQRVEHLQPKPAVTRATMSLGDIKAAIAPLAITAEGLSQLGFEPVARDKAAKLYAANDWPAICTAMVNVIDGANVPARKVG